MIPADKIYFPLVRMESDERELCDFYLLGFLSSEEAKALYPEAEILIVDPKRMIVVETDDFNPQDN